MTESLTTDLSRIADSFVIARIPPSPSRERPSTSGDRLLAVRCVLEGSVQRGGNRYRLNAQVAHTDRSHVWPERFDKPAADLFDMEDEIVSRLANILECRL